MLGDIFHDFCRLLPFFSSKLIFSKNSFRNTIKVSNIMDSNQERHFVSPDLGPWNKLFAKVISRRQKFQLASKSYTEGFNTFLIDRIFHPFYIKLSFT